jgi:hypothetical protein
MSENPRAWDGAARPTRRELLKLLPVSAVATAACGYSLAGRGSFLPTYVQTIAIPLFLNRTPFVTIEQLFTEKVRVEFQSRGRYTVNPVEPGADGVVRGEIMGLTAVPVAFTDQQLATRYRFTVSVSVKFDDLKEGKTLWENPGLTFSDEYELANGQSIKLAGAAFLDQERVAMDRLSTDFARSVVQAILEAF